MTSNLDAALAYARKGYPVFPCSENTKIPFKNTNGSKDATTDLDKITEWWSKFPNANIAMLTGSISGLYVVDIDVPASELMPRLPQTWTARTRNGG